MRRSNCVGPTPDATTRVCDVWLRDGIQGWGNIIPTADKIRVLRGLVAAQVEEIDVTSFVPPQVVPQFADATDILAEVDDGVRTRVLTVNATGVRNVIAAHRAVRSVDVCGFPYSVSEPHNIANLRRDHKQQRRECAKMVEALQEEGIEPLIGIATAFGCPIQGDVDEHDVLEVAAWAHDLGVRTMMFGDTTGMANPRSVTSLFDVATQTWPDVEFVGHFHDNRGGGIANTIAAIDAGAAVVDASLGGVGGEPASVEQGVVGEQGNVATEDLVTLLHAMGVHTGIDEQALLRAGRIAEQVLGRILASRVQRTHSIDSTVKR